MMSHLKLHFNNQERNDEKVLNAYPSIIQRRVRRFLYLDILHASMLFSGARQRFLDALLAAARVEAYLPNVSLTDGLCNRIKAACLLSLCKPAEPCYEGWRSATWRRAPIFALLQVELISEGDTVNELFVVVSGELSCYRVSSVLDPEVGRLLCCCAWLVRIHIIRFMAANWLINWLGQCGLASSQKRASGLRHHLNPHMRLPVACRT